jgi:hypothetical protein
MPYVFNDFGQPPGSGGIGPGPGMTAGHRPAHAGEFAAPAGRRTGSRVFSDLAEAVTTDSTEKVLLVCLLLFSGFNLMLNLFKLGKVPEAVR